MKAVRAVALAVAFASGAVAAANALAPARVELRYGAKAAPSQEAAQRLHAKAVELLESSQFNSRNPRWKRDPPKILDEYRQALSGKHFVVTYPQPQRVTTMGGEIGVRQIVIGLNRPDYANSLHTVDDEGRIVGHAKYSGPLCVEFLKLVGGL